MLLEYVQAALRSARYEKLEDGSYCGRIPKCPGTIAFARTLFDCQEELRSTLEDWLIVKLRHGDPIPVIGAVNLNRRASLRPALSAHG
jgi:predicted RNase H-like HicB family nuclease